MGAYSCAYNTELINHEFSRQERRFEQYLWLAVVVLCYFGRPHVFVL